MTSLWWLLIHGFFGYYMMIWTRLVVITNLVGVRFLVGVRWEMCFFLLSLKVFLMDYSFTKDLMNVSILFILHYNDYCNQGNLKQRENPLQYFSLRTTLRLLFLHFTWLCYMNLKWASLTIFLWKRLNDFVWLAIFEIYKIWTNYVMLSCITPHYSF